MLEARAADGIPVDRNRVDGITQARKTPALTACID
jgi:hypothetical protein